MFSIGKFVWQGAELARLFGLPFDGSDGSETTRFEYDCENRLTSAGPMSYSCDAFGRLATATGPGAPAGPGRCLAQKSTFTYDGGEVLHEEVRAGGGRIPPLGGAAGGLVRSTHHVRGPGGQLISGNDEAAQGSEPNPAYYHFDALGSVAALSHAQGESVATYAYEAFGNLTAGDTGLNTFTCVGNAFERRTGLYNFHARRYDPTVGRFLSQDPVAGLSLLPQTLNPYAGSRLFLSPAVAGRWPTRPERRTGTTP